jgi:hypothetical protein
LDQTRSTQCPQGCVWFGGSHRQRTEGSDHRGAAAAQRRRQLAKADQITLDGDASVLDALGGVLDTFDPTFKIVTP